MWNYQEDYKEKITAYLENLVKQDGYILEKYSVTTKDGYINVMYRIPRAVNEIIPQSKPAVILAHGMVCSSAVFIDQCPLAYYLVRNGFDVWLPNNRGTTFSTKHKDYDRNDQKDKYWDFSLEEIAIYDLTAFIDYVLDKTGQEKICHIGFSQGVTTFVIMASELPEYNEKITLSILLGSPVVFENISFFPVRFNAYILAVLTTIMEICSLGKFGEFSIIKEGRFFLSRAAPNTILRKLVHIMSAYVVGYRDDDQLQNFDYQRLGLTTPNSSSIRQFIHFGQLFRNKKFAKYDYGTAKNLAIYGCETPPEYKLWKVTAPVAIFYGKNDMYNDYKKDQLEKLLGNVVHVQIISHELYNHLDFIYAKDNVNLLYKHVLKLLKQYCTEQRENS